MLCRIKLQDAENLNTKFCFVSSILRVLTGLKLVIKTLDIWVIDQVRGQDGWILTKFLFCVSMDRDGVELHKHAKKRTRPISSHLGRTSLVNKGFITWLSGKFFLPDTAGSPERTI